MNPRAIGFVTLALLVLPVVIFGPEQYGYAFFGLLAGAGAFAKLIGSESLIWMIVFPALTIVLMVLFATAAIASIAFSIMQIAECPQTIIQKRIIRFVPVGFALCVIVGLSLLSLFPGEPPIGVSMSLFLFPSASIVVSGVHAIRKQ